MITKYRFGRPFETGAVVSQEYELKNVDEKQGKMQIGPVCWEKEIGFSYQLEEKDIVYGLGQQIRGINKRGWKYISDNFDNPHHQEDSPSLYGSHNFILVSGKEKYALFFDYPAKMVFDIGYSKSDEMTITAESYDMDVYLITGKSETEIVQSFRHMIGQSYMAPRWALGYGQSRWGYKSEQEIRQVAKEYRDRKIPIDSIYLDIDYMERYKDFTINEETFPHFEKLVEDMKSMDIHLVPIIDAGVKIEDGYDVYEQGKEKGYFCKDQDGNDFVAAVWPGRVHLPDVLNEDAAKWFGNQYRFLMQKGIDGFWNDMNEPAIFYTEDRLRDSISQINELAKTNMGIQEYFEMKDIVNGLGNHPKDYELFYHKVGSEYIRHDKVHNLYGYYLTKATSEALDEICPDQRTLLFSRSSYIGMHRYAGIWQGDNKSWWSHLLMNIQMTCNLNMVGFLYTGADMGGFGSDTTADLMQRWIQFAMFTPLMRNHSANGTRMQELYRFENVDAMKDLLQLRYRLLPYIYSEYMKAALTDTMMFKPLAFEYTDARSKEVEDQLLFGNELMLIPVYTQNTTGRFVYLPEEMMLVRINRLGKVETEVMQQGDYYISYEYNELVFFIRKGKAFPYGKMMQSSASIQAGDDYQLIGYEKASYELYEDDGIRKPAGNLKKYIRILLKN